LEKLEEIFDFEFVKKLLMAKYRTRQNGNLLEKNILFLSTKFEENCLKLLQWLGRKFSNDSKFIDDFLHTNNDEKQNFLFEVIAQISKDKPDCEDFFKVLQEIQHLRNRFLDQPRFLEKLFLHHDRNKKTIFHSLAVKMEIDHFSITNFKKLLEWLDDSFDRDFAKKVNRILSNVKTRAFETVDLKDIVFESESDTSLLIPAYSIKFCREIE
jgi:hypothetical protein